MSQRFQFEPIAVLTAIVMILVFQNCSQTPQETSNSSLEETTPFAYSAQVDTIAHMTCAGLNDSGPDRRAYFSFRVGAYNPATGGLSTTQEFRDHTAYFNVDQRARVFGVSARNSNTNLSLSIRSTADYQRVWKEGVIRSGEELDALVPDLDSARISGPLAALAPGQRINYFPSSADHRLLEGSLRYYHFENTMSETRSALDQRQSLLAVSYSDTSDVMDTRLRVPPDTKGSVSLPANRAYGTGYLIRFGLPGVTTAGEPRVILPNGGIEEIDLRTGTSVASNWDCSASYQFEIVLPDDLKKTPSLMSPTVDQTPTDADSLAALTAIRRVLRVEDWFVDLARRRVMAKRNDDYCYSSQNGRAIQYGQAKCANSSTTMCSHYVSVCLRR